MGLHIINFTQLNKWFAFLIIDRIINYLFRNFELKIYLLKITPVF